MTLLSTAELASMRMEADRYLSGTCTISRPTAGHTPSGAPSLTYATLATGVACRLGQPVSSEPEGEVSEALGAVVSWPLHLKYDQDISMKDRVVFGGNTYEVMQVLDSSSWLVTKRVIVVRVK